MTVLMRMALALLLLSSPAFADDAKLINGTLTIGNQPVALPGVNAGKVTTASFGGQPLYVVETGTEAIIVGQKNGAWRELARTPIGGAGLDADYSVAVAATPDGVYRYQTRPGGGRCDGKPSYLFGEVFDGTRFRRVSKLPIDVPASAPTVTARVDASAPPDAVMYRARFASHQPGAADASALGSPCELDDGKPATAWREELAGSAGEGQYFNFVPRDPAAKATRVRIVPGAAKDTNRPARLAIVSATGAVHVELPDAARDKDAAYVADLPAPLDGCVSVIIEKTYGPAKGTTSIAELAVYATDDGDTALAKVVADGKVGATSAGQALTRRGAAAVPALDAELARTNDPAARGRLVRVAIGIRDPAAAPILSRAIAEGSLTGADLIAAVRALAGLGAGADLAELAVKPGTPLEVRAAAAAALSASDPKERDLLVSLAGRGSREVRQAVIGQLAVLDVATLVSLAQAQGNPAAAGDIWRAVTRRAHTASAEAAQAAVAMSAALPGATDYELRYRLIDGIAATGDAAALKALAATLAAYPLDEKTAAYKQIAARAIATNPRPEASDLVISFTRDRDPGVRLAGLAAVATATGTGAGPWNGNAGVDGVDRVIMTLLATDTWPDVRRASAAALATRCMRPGPAQALGDAVDKDADLTVRTDALGGLVECKARGVADRLAKLWDNGKAPLELRGRAIDLTANVGDMALGAKLIAKLQHWRAAALESEDAAALAPRAAIAIGRLGPPGAAEALLDATRDEAFPDILAAAATGLGLLGSRCTPAARERLGELSASDEPQVSTAARHAAAICSKK
jgi:hypothetical protein